MAVETETMYFAECDVCGMYTGDNPKYFYTPREALLDVVYGWGWKEIRGADGAEKLVCAVCIRNGRHEV